MAAPSAYALSSAETGRYLRQIIQPSFGEDGQLALKRARVLVVGAGGLGTPVIAYLAAAGVGSLGIVDHDKIAVSNLQRQVIYQTASVGQSKVMTAAAFVAALNPHVEVTPLQVRLDAANAQALVWDYDLVIDGTDNTGTRRNVALAASLAGKRLVAGAILGMDGLVTSFEPRAGAMPKGFDVVFPDIDERDVPACEANGVLGVTTGVIGTLMAAEAVKLITGIGDPLAGRLLLYDGQSTSFTEIALGDDVEDGAEAESEVEAMPAASRAAVR